MNTNVLLAYCFLHDTWKGRAEAVLRTEYAHFISDKVVKEFEIREEEIVDEFNVKIVELSERMHRSNKDLFEVDEKHKIFKKADKQIRPFIIKFLDSLEFPISRNELINSIEELYLDLLRFKEKRYDDFCQKLDKIYTRDNDYPTLKAELKKLGIHNGERDRGILLDAHDLATLDQIYLNFVSTDNDICNNREGILELLGLEDIIDLKYYLGMSI